MSVNPCFDVAILLARCKSDIEKFIKIIKEKDNILVEIKDIEDYYNKITRIILSKIQTNSNIETIKTQKNTCINMLYSLTKPDSNNNVKSYMMSFDYLHSVSEIMKTDIKKARQCWILRTILFYLLLISATLIMQDKILFDIIFPESKLTFKFNIRSELKNFHLGIFGSLNPTSDIDVGIRYVGDKHDLCALDYVVCVVEDLFPSFLGVESSLKLDIEPYADMYILPNLDEKTKSEFPDIFFLNTSNFTDDDFTEVLPYVYASIIRNYIKGLHIDAKKKENIAMILQKIENLKTDNLAFLTVIDYVELSNKIPSQYKPEIIPNITTNVDNKITEKLILEFLNLHKVKITEYIGTNINIVAFEKGLDITLKYMQNDYNVSRQEYYTLVKKAENSLIPVKQQIYGSSSGPLDTNAIKECMKNIMHSLVYREESYVCPATITHIVRTIQDSKFKEKYPTNDCGIMDLNTKEITNPYCSIGNYGFLISAMEQYGYLFRFYNSYCNIEDDIEVENKNKIEDSLTDNNRSEDDGKHCKSKNEKYIYRFYDAIYNIEKKKVELTEGGSVKRKSRKIRKRSRKNRKSKRTRIIRK